MSYEATRSVKSAHDFILQGAKSILSMYRIYAECMSDRRRAMELESQVPDPLLPEATSVSDTEGTIFGLSGFPKGNLGRRL